MSRWARGEAEIERMLRSGELQTLKGAGANGGPWLTKAATIQTAESVSARDPHSGYTLAYDATESSTVSPARRAEVIDALRRGTVPRAGLDLFAVGMERSSRLFGRRGRLIAVEPGDDRTAAARRAQFRSRTRRRRSPPPCAVVDGDRALGAAASGSRRLRRRSASPRLR